MRKRPIGGRKFGVWPETIRCFCCQNSQNKTKTKNNTTKTPASPRPYRHHIAQSHTQQSWNPNPFSSSSSVNGGFLHLHRRISPFPFPFSSASPTPHSPFPSCRRSCARRPPPAGREAPVALLFWALRTLPWASVRTTGRVSSARPSPSRPLPQPKPAPPFRLVPNWRL